MTTGLAFATALEELQRGSFGAETVHQAFAAILRGEWTPAQVAGLLIGLRVRGESVATVVAAARAMRDAMLPVEHDLDAVLDTCGTGGDSSGTLNLSTGAAILVAATGFPVAKHGNRAASSRCGSADVLEALGVQTGLNARAAAQCLKQTGITFMLAPVFHPCMRHAAPVRKELGVRTLFNCLGPLANPAGATHQLIGTYDDALRPIMAQALIELGITRAWLVRSADGLDEISPCATTHVTEVTASGLKHFDLTPEDFGLPRLRSDQIAGADAPENAAALRMVIEGGNHPAAPAFVLNAAAALVVARDLPLVEAASSIAHAIASGAAQRKLEDWIGATQHLGSAP